MSEHPYNVFEAFFAEISDAADTTGGQSLVGSRRTKNDVRIAWDKHVMPHLAIPRSLKTDPPKEGEFIVLGRPCCVAQIHIQRLSHIDPSYTHWIPFPELPPDPDEDEFEKHWETVDQDAVDEASYKAGWLAARKDLDETV